jgi:uncharacterized membrane protein YedE/YeeE
MITGLSPYIPALAGGVLIGLASGGFFLFQGRIAGISGIARSAFTLEKGGWRWAFLAGLVVAGLVHGLIGGAVAPALPATPPALLALAGVVVGLGSGIGSGCTSGHGVCGLARLSGRSLLAVVVFMASASVTVFLMRHGIPA